MHFNDFIHLTGITLLSATAVACGGSHPPAVAPASPQAPPVASQPSASPSNPAAANAGFLSGDCARVPGGAEAAQLNDRACDGGDAMGCSKSAMYIACGIGVPRDLRRAGERAA